MKNIFSEIQGLRFLLKKKGRTNRRKIVMLACMYIPGDSVFDLIDGLLIGQLRVNNMETGKLTPYLRH